MPFTNAAENTILAAVFGGVAIPSTSFPVQGTSTSNCWGVGLIAATTWYPGWTVSAGQYCVPNNNGTPWAATNLGWTALPSSSTGRIFICTTGGTTNSVGQGPPTWPTSIGGTVTETNGVAWAEVSSATYFGGGTFTGAAPTGGGYAPINASLNQTVGATGFTTAATVSSIGQVQNGSAGLSFPLSTGAYGVPQQVGFTLTDVSHGGVKFWGLLQTCFLVASSGLTPAIASGGLTINLQ